MTSITRASEKDFKLIAGIGKISLEEAHRDSCSAEEMQQFLAANYNDEAIRKDLTDPENIYHLLNYNDIPVGFSKIILNARHPNIQANNTTKLDRIYVLSEYHNVKLGYELLKFNIEFCKQNNQQGIWLFTWTGNTKAVNFYLRAGFTIIGSHQFKVTETHYNPNHQMFLEL